MQKESEIVAINVKANKLTGTSVSGMPRSAATNMQTTSPIFDDIMYLMNCFVLL